MRFTDDTVFTEKFANELESIETLVSLGALRKSYYCPSCGSTMTRVVSEKKKVFRCQKLQCGEVTLSYSIGSFFFGTKIGCREVMRLARYWIQATRRNALLEDKLFNRVTVTSWYRRFSMMVADHFASKSYKLGGPGETVEIDEMKLGRRKYNRGHRVDGIWIVTGIERTPERKIIAVPVEYRDANTLERVIRNHVHEGSIVCTDEWKGYSRISEHCGVGHITVNHSRNFRDPVSGACTNTVEGLNSAIKAAIPPQFRTDRHALHKLREFIWRRQNRGRLCDAFIDALRDYIK